MKYTEDQSILKEHFSHFREHIMGLNQEFPSPYGPQKMLYADWTASGRFYKPIEDMLSHELGPYVANTHTETTFSGSAMTQAYQQARNIIKQHVNAGEDDVLITYGTGMTGAVNKFQRILGLKVVENLKEHTQIPEHKRPLILLTHMEHHSNQTSWLETIARVKIVPCDEHGLISLENFEAILKENEHYPLKIASVTACSNVTGITTNYHEIARLMHKYNGLCFVDFACSAPYVEIDMHPEDAETSLDAIFFSPHKFLGGPGAAGVLIFNKKLYKNHVPDNPGGGTVTYTNPWGEHDYVDHIETREDGGTPGFLQTIRAAMAIKLKETMGTEQIHAREKYLNRLVFEHLDSIPNLNLLASEHRDRLSIFSFYIDNAHYNLVVKLLNDRFGIQTRGGCSCAGTYGHYLLHVDQATSKSIEKKILEGCLLDRPGWVRMSLHPTMTEEEVHYICDAIAQVARHFKEWSNEYVYDATHNEFKHRSGVILEQPLVERWFNF